MGVDIVLGERQALRVLRLLFAGLRVEGYVDLQLGDPGLRVDIAVDFLHRLVKHEDCRAYLAPQAGVAPGTGTGVAADNQLVGCGVVEHAAAIRYEAREIDYLLLAPLDVAQGVILREHLPQAKTGFRGAAEGAVGHPDVSLGVDILREGLAVGGSPGCLVVGRLSVAVSVVPERDSVGHDFHERHRDIAPVFGVVAIPREGRRVHVADEMVVLAVDFALEDAGLDRRGGIRLQTEVVGEVVGVYRGGHEGVEAALALGIVYIVDAFQGIDAVAHRLVEVSRGGELQALLLPQELACSLVVGVERCSGGEHVRYINISVGIHSYAGRTFETAGADLAALILAAGREDAAGFAEGGGKGRLGVDIGIYQHIAVLAMVCDQDALAAAGGVDGEGTGIDVGGELDNALLADSAGVDIDGHEALTLHAPYIPLLVGIEEAGSVDAEAAQGHVAHRCLVVDHQGVGALAVERIRRKGHNQVLVVHSDTLDIAPCLGSHKEHICSRAVTGRESRVGTGLSVVAVDCLPLDI